MWSNVISIDKMYDREIEYILSRLHCTKDMSFAIEESDDRIWIYLASACENIDHVENILRDIAQTVFLSFFKLRFFAEKMNIRHLNYAMCALLSSMIHFDRDFESTVVLKVLSNVADYNLDGVMNFRLRALKDSWEELTEVANRLVEGSSADGDIFDIAAFITGSDGGKNQIVLTKNTLKNITRHKNVEVVKLFDEDEYNLISAIISQSPCEILLDGCKISSPMCATLKKLARVIEK